MSQLQKRIRLIEITNDLDDAHGLRKKVALAFYPREDVEPMITMAWHLDPGEYDDANLVPLARHYFHWICTELAAATGDWSLDAEALEELKKKHEPHPAVACTRTP